MKFFKSENAGNAEFLNKFGLYHFFSGSTDSKFATICLIFPASPAISAVNPFYLIPVLSLVPGERIFMSLIKLNEAAETIGVSYPTIKQWIYKGKIRAVKTAGGHYRIPQEEIDRLLKIDQKEDEQTSLSVISGRNKLLGTVVEARYEGLLAQITLDIGGQFVTSIITSDSARNLGLKKGVSAYALIKATEVMIIRK
jgi:molybdopterin-binding protein